MSNQKKFDAMYDRIFGALPSLPHRGARRLADDKDITDLPNRIMNYQVPWYGFDGKTQPKGQRNTVSLGTMIGWLDSGIHNLMTAIKANGAKLDGLQAAVTELGKRQGIDPNELAKLVDAAVKQSIKDSLGTYELTRVED